MGKFGIWELLLIVAIVVLLFGTKKLRSLGGDIGEGLKSFRRAMKEPSQQEELDATKTDEQTTGRIIEGEKDPSAKN